MSTSIICRPNEVSRLWFDSTSGLARHDGVSVDLDHLPKIPGLPEHMRAVDFCPATRVAMVRESARAWREMTAPERAAALQFLHGVADAVRGVVA